MAVTVFLCRGSRVEIMRIRRETTPLERLENFLSPHLGVFSVSDGVADGVLQKRPQDLAGLLRLTSDAKLVEARTETVVNQTAHHARRKSTR